MIEIWKIREHPQIAEEAARWFHEKWHIPLKVYQESIRQCLKNESAVPQWYLAMDQWKKDSSWKSGISWKIVGGLGVIENDFHNRKDLTPNVCAVYVEENQRCQGIAGELLKAVCDDMAAQGIPVLYLLTDHTSFYERYGWEFLCMVQGDGEPEMSRMYVHRQ